MNLLRASANRLSACGRALRPWLWRTLLPAAVLDPSGPASPAERQPCRTAGGYRMQFDQLKRREFIALFGGVAAWPLAARAQHAEMLPTVGFLGTTTPSIMSQWTAAFVGRLRELGWIEGRTIKIEYRWAEGRGERYAEIAAEFVRLKVDVIVTTGPAAPQTTSVIPIV